MVGRYCSVALCGNSHSKNASQGISFHRIPKDPVIRKQWVTLCKRQDPVNPDTAWICSEHFSKNCFEKDVRHELLGGELKRRKLKKNVIPTEKIPNGLQPPKSFAAYRRMNQRLKEIEEMEENLRRTSKSNDNGKEESDVSPMEKSQTRAADVNAETGGEKNKTDRDIGQEEDVVKQEAVRIKEEDIKISIKEEEEVLLPNDVPLESQGAGSEVVQVKNESLDDDFFSNVRPVFILLNPTNHTGIKQEDDQVIEERSVETLDEPTRKKSKK